jgi:arsenite methyltransferase
MSCPRATDPVIARWAKEPSESLLNRTTMMKSNDTIREQVARDYARAVSTPAAPETGACCGPPEQRGVAAQLAGYEPEALQSLPADAVVNSFGCGDPVTLADMREGQVVLDLGCGAGIDILLAAKKVGPRGRAIGIDMTDEMIARANENIRASGLTNVEARKGIIEELPVESASVDWVISNCVINLSPEKERVFAEIARVLRPGGRISISDIMVEDLPEWVEHDPRLYSACVAGAISEEEYVQGLRDASLTDVQVTGRFVYDSGQIRAFIASELAGEVGDASACGCGGSADASLAEDISEDVAGRVWSARIEARKPPECG